MSAHSSEGFASPADLAACRALLCGGSRSFFAASFLLPDRVADAATSLYAFCRLADDVIDFATDHRGALESLHVRLDRAYAGCPADIPADRAFADVVARFAIPKALPSALLEGFAWDAAGRRYTTLSDLYAYATRVAGTVGAMMSILMGAREPDVVARACDLGIAMQLTNIARDVGEDARAGRLYLPRQWLYEAGIDADVWLERPVFDEKLGAIVQRLLHSADVLYERAENGIHCLPSGCRSGIYAARYLYAEIGREIERRGLDSISQRAVVTTRRKLQLLMRSYIAARLSSKNPPPAHLPPALKEAQFLIDAIAQADHALHHDPASRRDMDQQWAWLIDLFTRLERREQFSNLSDRPPYRPPDAGGMQSETR